MDISYYKQYEPICGKWYLGNEIGRGSFGVVFESERRDIIKEKVAIKVVSIPSSQSEVESFRQEHYTLDEKSVTSYFYGFVEEFLKEIKTMALFQDHSNVVNIKDYEVRQRKDEIGWDIFIIMELLTPANKYFAENGITEENVIKFGIDMCYALEECKKQNIIHRDIKPSNIFISSNGDFKLGDFGVARTLEKTSSGFSKKGTYTYMAPEVYKGEDYDSSIDIYSLGIVMYKLLNNNFEPFKTGNNFADEENALIRRMRGEKIVDGPANASSELTDIILKACSYDPEQRYSSPYDMRVALENIGKWDTTPPLMKNNFDIRATTGEKTQNNITNSNGNTCVTADIVTNSKSLSDFEVHNIDYHSTEKDKAEYSVVISTTEALRGGNKEIVFKDGIKKTISIPVRCNNGQVVNGVCIYVHDFNTKISSMELQKMPDPVLEMYANHSSGLVGGIVLAFIIWMIFGMATMLIPVMAIGIMLHIVTVFVISIKKQQTIDEAKRLLEQRKRISINK